MAMESAVLEDTSDRVLADLATYCRYLPNAYVREAFDVLLHRIATLLTDPALPDTGDATALATLNQENLQLFDQIEELYEELAVLQDTVEPRQRSPLRRIVDVAHILFGTDLYFPLLSCGHQGPPSRPKDSILKDVEARRRMLCHQCQSDV
jgi:hypothetical protein